MDNKIVPANKDFMEVRLAKLEIVNEQTKGLIMILIFPLWFINNT